LIGYSIYGRSDLGLVRKNNEDALLIKPNVFLDKTMDHSEMIDPTTEIPLLAIADGMGGENAGEVASSIALETLQEFLSNNLRLPSSEDEILACIELSLLEGHRRILEYASLNPTSLGMGTTMVASILIGSKVYCSWVGDSRMYLYSSNYRSHETYKNTGGLHLITDDHSLVWREVKSGTLSPEAARKSSKSNIITQSLGDPLQIPQPESVVIDLLEGDVLMLCSDGLNGMLSEQSIEQALAKVWKVSPKDLAEDLIVKSKIAGGSDNISVIVCAYGDKLGNYMKHKPFAISSNRKKSLNNRLILYTLFSLTLVVIAWAINRVHLFDNELVVPNSKNIAYDSSLVSHQGDTGIISNSVTDSLDLLYRLNNETSSHEIKHGDKQEQEQKLYEKIHSNDEKTNKDDGNDQQ
jgi:PPM family protein phosphatase